MPLQGMAHAQGMSNRQPSPLVYPPSSLYRGRTTLEAFLDMLLEPPTHPAPAYRSSVTGLARHVKPTGG